MSGPNRRSYLKQLVAEYIEAGVGKDHWEAIIDKLLADGHITEAEIRSFGISGFHRDVIRPVQTARDEAGRDKYVATKSGGIVQLEFADLSDLVFAYYRRKHHISASEARLAVMRQQIIDQHSVDPEDLDDPLAGHEPDDED